MINEIEKKKAGNRIKEIREQSGLTMEEFIEHIDGNSGKGRSGTVNNWESGQNLPNKKRLQKIASLGNVSVNYILHGTELLTSGPGFELIQKHNKGTTSKSEEKLVNEMSIESAINREAFQSDLSKAYDNEFNKNVEYLLNHNFASNEKLLLSTVLFFSYTLFKYSPDKAVQFQKLFSGLREYIDPNSYNKSRSKEELQSQLNKYFNELLTEKNN